jgi:eukaryotic-like serine/threonine-protein kinase
MVGFRNAPGPRWSPDGALLYFVSERDGFRCLWAQRLEPTAKTPFGPAVPAHHFHRARRSLKDVPFQYLEMGVAPDKIVLPLAERTGNIWMASH